MLQFIRNHPLMSFFTLAFVLAWSILIPLVLSSYGLFPEPPVALLIAMGYAPTIAAVAVSAVIGGGAEVKGLLRRLLIWRVGWRWWAVTLFLNGAIILAALGLYGLIGNEMPPFPELRPGLVLDILFGFAFVALINGEEVGWRGFALPRLQRRYGLIVTVVVLGGLETLFHLPIFFNNGASEAGGQNGMPFWAFTATSMLAVTLFIWVYNATHGSLLIATMFHASMNAWSNILPFPATSESFLWLVAIMQVVVLAAILVAKRLADGRLPVAEQLGIVVAPSR
jgi:membrane protease YdiL (CAAX protease family)